MSHQLLLIEHLVRLATATMALREVEFLLNEAELTDEQLARLQALVAELDFQQGLSESLLGERGMGYHAFHHMEQMNFGDVTAKPNPGDGNLTRPADCRLYLGFMQEMIAASREPFPGALDGANRSEQRLKQLAGTQEPAGTIQRDDDAADHAGDRDELSGHGAQPGHPRRYALCRRGGALSAEARPAAAEAGGSGARVSVRLCRPIRSTASRCG